MGKTGFEGPIQKVRYLQIITSDTAGICGHGEATLPVRVPSLHLMHRYSQGKIKNQESTSRTKKEGNCTSILQYSRCFSSPYDQRLYFPKIHLSKTTSWHSMSALIFVNAVSLINTFLPSFSF